MIISKYKNWQPRSIVPESDGVPFSQRTRGQPNSTNPIEDWMKDKECCKCEQKGHIATVCPAKKGNNDLDDDDKSKKSSLESSRRKNHSEKKKKKPNNSSKKTMKKIKSPTITDSPRLVSAL